jgi:hypothetical protein
MLLPVESLKTPTYHHPLKISAIVTVTRWPGRTTRVTKGSSGHGRTSHQAQTWACSVHAPSKLAICSETPGSAPVSAARIETNRGNVGPAKLAQLRELTGLLVDVPS